MNKFLFPFIFISFCLTDQTKAQLTFPVNGIHTPVDQLYLIKGAHIQIDSSRFIQQGMLLFRKNKIVAVGSTIDIPKDAIIIEAGGKYIYPAFVESFCNYGIPEGKKSSNPNDKISEREGSYSWNEALRCDQDASSQFKYHEEQASKYRKAGFALVQTHVADGISRGAACVLSLDNKNENELLLKSRSAHVLSFYKGSSTQSYPSSLMGSIALLRQTYLDGLSYSQAILPKERNLTLESWNALQSLPVIMATDNLLNELRAIKLYKEWQLNSIVLKASGKEYQRIQECKQSGVLYIVPLSFPAPYEISDPYDIQDIELADLKHWEMAPANPAQLYKNKIPFVFSMEGLKTETEFLNNLRKSVQYGLPESSALYALTGLPAKILGIDSVAGSLEQGKWANFIITNGRLFDEQTQILETWILGNQYKHQPVIDSNDILGDYKFIIDTQVYTLNIGLKANEYRFKLTAADSGKHDIVATLKDRYFSGRINRQTVSGSLLFSATRETSGFKGKALLEDGSWEQIVFEKIADINKDISEIAEKTKIVKTLDIDKVYYPFCAYGWTSKPEHKTYLFKNATVWTNEKEGILENTDVLIHGGKIQKLGKNLKDSDAIIIDGSGKHLSPGIIDEHSHIAINGSVNECTHSITAEVRIGDVINSEDVNIYRQLAGGVTTAHLLHGSCNPIGGQTALIKMRWGLPPEQLKFEEADGFIKFALGENVKRSGGNSSSRYPDTRMGVEQIYLDAFQRAKEYELALKLRPQETRRNLQLDALVEILNKKRFITCHSYVQSEINMMMKVADQYGFTLNTFTHILEGYKVADLMKKHGAGAAGFADWWAYKFEVYEAIPYNGALLHQEGVVTAFNSDDAEMARRLNQEAAKAVMYGNVAEEEALKFVTLNPAKLLHIDHRVGSIRKGKDADLVLWNDHPLSIKASADMTFVDGIKYFDREENKQLQRKIKEEKNRLIQKMIKAKASGEKTENYRPKRRRLQHCDSDHAEID